MLYTLLVGYIAACITYTHTVLLVKEDVRNKYKAKFNDQWLLKVTAASPVIVGAQIVDFVKSKCADKTK